MTATVDERRRALAQPSPDLSAVKEAQLSSRIRLALSDEQPLTGDTCMHGWDRAVCAMKVCANPYALEPLLEEAARVLDAQEAEIARLREIGHGLRSRLIAARGLSNARADRIETLEGALRVAERFIVNGVELGFIRMPETATDPAHETLPTIRQALRGGAQ